MARNKSFFWKFSRECALSFGQPRVRKNHFLCRSCGNSGFSLVEVVLAMGIIAVAFIPLMGLLPIGLNTSQQAIDTTVQAQILQQMTGLAQEAGWSNLSTLCKASAPPTYFDANGTIVSLPSAAVYTAAFSTPTNTVLPGGSTTTALDAVTIYILKTQGGASGVTLQSQVAIPAATKSTVLLANNGL